MRLAFDATRGSAWLFAATTPAGLEIVYPPATHRRRAVGFPDEERVIILDGMVSDWGTIAPLVVGLPDDGTPSLRWIKIFAFANPLDSFLYFRFGLHIGGGAPVALDDSYKRKEDQGLTVSAPGVLKNDTDPSGAPLTAVPVSTTGRGDLTLNPDGSFTYTPDNPGSLIGDTFEYKASNGSEESNVAEVKISVTEVNHAPVVDDQTMSVDENSANGTVVGTVVFTDEDVDDTHTFAILSGNGSGAFAINSSTGQITVANGSVLDFEVQAQYILNVNVTDSGSPGKSDTANITIDLNDVNDAPVATADSGSVNEDAPLNVAAPGVLANDTDEDSDPLTAVLVSGPSHAATFALNADGSYGYTPVADYFGADSFSYQANDGTANSNTVTVSLTVVSVNDAPSFNVGLDQTVDEDDPAQTVNGWATGISRGPANESGQTVAFVIDNNTNAALFSVQPSVAPDGTLTYTPLANANGVATITLHLTDNGGTANGGVDASGTQSFMITVNAVNDPPTFVLGANQTVDEDDPGQTVPGFASSISVGPPDESGQTITAFNVSNDNNGLFSSQPAIATNGTLTYTPAADANGSATVSVTATDSGGATSSPAQTFLITVNAVNDAPVVTAPANASANEDTPIVFPGTISVADIDAGALNVTVTLGAVHGTLTLSGTSGLSVTGNGTTNVSATGSLANLNAALNGLTYNPDLNYDSTDTLTVSANDNGNTGPGGAQIDTELVALSLTPVNDAPVINAGSTRSYSEGDAPIQLEPLLTITDVDSTMVQCSAPNDCYVQITGNTDTGNDLLACPACAGLGITAAWSAPSNLLSLTGAGTIADYQTAMRSVTFQTLTDTPIQSQRGLDWFIRDSGGAQSADTFQNDTLINVTAVNDAPVNTVPGAQVIDEDMPLTFTGGTAITVADPDSDPDHVEVTLAATNGTLTLNPGATGALSTLTGDGTASIDMTGTIAEVNAAMNGMAYQPTPDASGAGSVSITTDDQGHNGTGGALSDGPDTVPITINAVNDAPVVTTSGGTTAFVEDGGAVAVDGGVTVTDVDSANLAQAVVTITNVQDGAAETLSAPTLLGSATASFVSPTLTISGSATVAQYEQMLQAVTYENTSDTPTTTDRTISFQVDDGGGVNNLSNVANKSVSVTATNDAPVLTLSGTLSFTEGDAASSAATSAMISDLDDTNIESATIQITGNYQNGQDVLSYAPALGISGSFNAGAAGGGLLTLTGSASLADYQTALLNVKYSNASDNPSTLARTLTWKVNDGDVDSNAQTSTINIAAVNDPPVNTVPTNPQSVNEDTALNFTGAGNTFSVIDPDAASGNISVQLVTTNGTTTIVTPGAVVFGPGANGSASYTMTGTLAQVNSALGSLRFDPTPNFPGALASDTATITMNTSDNGNTPAPAQTDNGSSINITVNQVNDPPTAVDEAFDTIGNTELRIDLGAGATPNVAHAAGGNGVRNNDSDPVEGNPFTVTSVVGCADMSNCTLASGSHLSMNANGTFSFVPSPTLANGAPTNDTFDYVITDQPAAGTPLTDTGTVTIHVYDKVWYVKQGVVGGNGTSTLPLGNFDNLDGGADLDGPGDYIFVQDSGALTLSLTVLLEANQHLLGEGVGLSINRNLNGDGAPANLVPAGNRPVLTIAPGDALSITEAMPVEIRGLSLSAAGGRAIFLATVTALSGSPSLTIGDNTFAAASALGDVDINLNTGTTGTLSLAITNNTWNIAGTHMGNAIDVLRNGGQLNLNLSGNTNILSAATAVNIAGGAATSTFITGFANNSIHQSTGGSGVVIGDATFDATPGGGINQVNAGTLSIGVSGDGVGAGGLTMTNVVGDVTFSDLDIDATSSGLARSGTGTLTFAASGTPTIVTTAGPAVNITGAALNLPLTLLTSTTTSSGVNLNTVSGSFSAGSGSAITKSSGAGTAFSVASGSVNVNYQGSLNVSSGAGVSLTSNTGTMTFSGLLTLSTGANSAFSATGGGTVTATNTSNTLATTTATALNVSGTQIGSGGLKFTSISANGASKGIILNNTGTAAGNGGLAVSGTGATDGSGGTIQNISLRGGEFISTKALSLTNMNFTNANTSDAGGAGVCEDLTTTACNAAIYLSSVSGAAFDNINITGTTVEEGINGNSVSNFTLNNSTITNCGTSQGGSDLLAEEACIKMRELTGTTSITNSDLAFPGGDVVEIVNTAGPLLKFNVDNTLFRDSQASPQGNTGVQLRSQGTASMVANFTNSQFLRIRTHGLNAQAINSASNDVDVSGCTFDRGSGDMIGMSMEASNSAPFVFNIQNNPKVWAANGPAINVFGDNSANINGRINNNPDVKVSDSTGHIGTGIRANINKDAVAKLEIKNNVVNVNTADEGIEVSAIGKTAGNPGGATNTADVTITGNNITIGASQPSDYAIRIFATSSTSETNAMCANVASNTTAIGGTSTGHFRARVPEPGGYLRLQGFSSDIPTTWNNNLNTPTTGSGAIVSGGGSGTLGPCLAALPINGALDADP